MTKQQLRQYARVYLVDNRKTTLAGLALVWAGLGIISLALPDDFTQPIHWRHLANEFFKGACSMLSGVGLIWSKDAHPRDEAGPTASTEGPIPASAVVPDEQFNETPHAPNDAS